MHYLPGENDHGEAFRRFDYVDYYPTHENEHPFYEAVKEWLDAIHAHIDKAATEERYHT